LLKSLNKKKSGGKPDFFMPEKGDARFRGHDNLLLGAY
jgi:hypothetical protein